MDMDDPWGSPWADDNDVSPRPRADVEVKAATPAKTIPTTPKVGLNSPWDDGDDGFGDWSTGVDAGEHVAGSNGNTLDDPWATKDEFHKPNTSSGASQLLPAWDQNLTLPEENVSNLLSPKENITRQSSPDPWATEAASYGGHGDRTQRQENSIPEDLPKTNVEGQLLPKTSDEEQEATTIDLEAETETPRAQEPEVVEQNEHQAGLKESNLSHVLIGQHLDQPGPLDPDLIIQGGSEKSPLDHVETLGTNTREQNSVGLDPSNTLNAPHQSAGTGTTEDPNHSLVNPDIESSRSSSAPSDHSRHDEQIPDSPRTSLDEEQGRPHVSRKVSKVHELVQHFDSIIAQQVAEPEPITRTPQKVANQQLDDNTEEPEDEGDDFGDFGDFEEGMSDDEEPEPISDFGEPQPSNLESTKKDEPVISRSPKDYGPVTFEVDAKSLETLYSDASAATDETIFIPDTIIHDTFQSVEQRKTWYRVSRYGTMRKYNSGDDENYKRVRWSKSSVRDETLKVVARWMEEDRISGRVVLGGGSKGSSIFGWNDSSQRPVAISSALADKRGKKKSQEAVDTVPEVPREWPKMSPRHSSRENARHRSSSKGMSQGKEPQIKEPQVKEPKPEEAPTANFGWNMPPKDPYGTKAQSPIQRVPTANSTSKARSISPQTTPGRKRSESINRSPLTIKVLKTRVNTSATDITPVKVLPNTTGPVLPAKHLVSTSTDGAANEDPTTFNLEKKASMIDEEDDWGDMISSPTMAPTHTFPTQKGLRHKKSMSLSEFSAPVPFSSTAEPQAPRPQSSQTTKPAMNFGTIGPPVEIQGLQSQHEKSSINLLPNMPAQNDQKPTPVPVASADSAQDPWASADFSFFDAGPPPAPAPKSSSKSVPLSSGPPVKSVSFAANPEPADSVPSQKRGSYRTKEEIEQDRIVRSIVDALPDLSYMLR